MRNVQQQRLLDLRAQIASIEKRPMLAGEGPGHGGSNRRQAVVAAPQMLEVPAGLLHEIYGEGQRHVGAALGFALGLGQSQLTPVRPALLLLQLSHQLQETGLPYGPGLVHFGLDPERVIIGRLANPVELLWAAEEAIACRAVAVVIVEVLGNPTILDFTASRRLSLRAAGGGASVLLVRYGVERQASAARLRWQVSPAASRPAPFDERAPGRPRWRVTLEKGRLKGQDAGADMLVEWTENGFERVDHERAAEVAPARALPAGGARIAPLSGPQPAALGHRLSQTG